MKLAVPDVSRWFELVGHSFYNWSCDSWSFSTVRNEDRDATWASSRFLFCYFPLFAGIISYQSHHRGTLIFDFLHFLIFQILINVSFVDVERKMAIHRSRWILSRGHNDQWCISWSNLAIRQGWYAKYHRGEPPDGFDSRHSLARHLPARDALHGWSSNGNAISYRAYALIPLRGASESENVSIFIFWAPAATARLRVTVPYIVLHLYAYYTINYCIGRAPHSFLT